MQPYVPKAAVAPQARKETNFNAGFVSYVEDGHSQQVINPMQHQDEDRSSTPQVDEVMSDKQQELTYQPVNERHGFGAYN